MNKFLIKCEDIKVFLSSQGYEMKGLHNNFLEKDLTNKNKNLYLLLYHNKKNNWYKVKVNALNFTIEKGLGYHKDISKQWRTYLKDTYKQHYTNYIKSLYLKQKQSLDFYESVLDDLNQENNEQTFEHT